MRRAKPPAWLATPPERVPWERLGWLGIAPCRRPQYVMAPSFLNYDEAERWAQAWAERQGGEPELTSLSTGDTLVRLASS
jgi:hypothetical protein